ncbi:hypothetical protein MNAN1_001425 [Malassezia nana]|uniref:PWWP domain-containing protein n=1 Tax=Malassezia nana TaxID=180528 RepID=A0AAF0EHA9_9BASI|nr:hypothetical protein MNAN1_001425 [Malassezia nana]
MSSRAFQVGDVVLAKIKGFSAWPGIIIDDEHVPQAVRDERPASKNALHTIRFFPAADYHWATPRDLTPLTPEDIDAFLARPKGKSADLHKAYKIAKDPHSWNEEQNRIVREHEKWLQEHGDEEEEEEDEEDDEADDDEEADKDDEADKRPTKAQRKRASAPASARTKRSRTDTEGASSEAFTEPQPDKEHTEEDLDPATRKVREWRHKLQRAFLSKGGVIVASDMDAQDATFKTVEAYTDMTVDQLRLTKIGKVMKRIHQLPEIPRDDEFHFRERAGELVKQWTALVGQATEDKEA